MYGINHSVEKNESDKRMTCLPCILMKDSIEPKDILEKGVVSHEVAFQSYIEKF